MNKTTSIIEINGNRYDAVSGQLINAAKKAAHHVKRPIDGLNIDGFTKPVRMIKRSAVRRSVHATMRKPEHSKTLMRNIVKKPASTKAEDKIKTRSLSPDYVKGSRAKNVPQNSKVQRFGLFAKGSATDAKVGEVIKSSATVSAAPGAAISASLPAVMSSASHHRLERLLDYALIHADSHKKSLDKSRGVQSKFFLGLPKWLVIAAAGLLVLAGAVFFVWRNVPAASFRLASVHAHVNASLPTPISGYKIGPITASEHSVITTIQSISDNSKRYTVTEQASNQPAASLSAAAAASASRSRQQVQTVQDQDKTYVLSQDNDKSTAACTKGSNTVSVESAGLNVAQLLEAAKNACKS